jgi:hypothetical protein
MKRTLAPLLFLALTAVAVSVEGQGSPDLQGVWNFDSGVPMQRPVALGDKKFFTREEAEKHRATTRNALLAIATIAPIEAVGLDWFDGTPRVENLRTSLISYPDNGRLPPLVQGVRRTPGIEDFITLLGDRKGDLPPNFAAFAAAFAGGSKASYTDFVPAARCLVGADVPLVPQLDDNYLQIIQSPDHVVLVTDIDRRIITLDGRPAIGEAVRSWAGWSRGRWEGETLVVDTRNFDGRSPSFAGAGTSRDKVVTERFTRTAKDRLEYSAVVVDPKTFQDRVDIAFPMALVDAQIHELGCHEGNYSMRNSLAAARMEDAKKAK